MVYQVYRRHEGEEQLLSEVHSKDAMDRELLFWLTERPHDDISWRVIEGPYPNAP